MRDEAPLWPRETKSVVLGDDVTYVSAGWALALAVDHTTRSQIPSSARHARWKTILALHTLRRKATPESWKYTRKARGPDIR